MSTIRKHNSDYYMNLKYPVEIRPLEDEPGYYASYPDFGGATAHGDGPTIEKALEEADISRRLTIEVMIEDGRSVPEPGGFKAFSGKFNVRVPKSLHRKLVLEAEREGVSLNMLIVSRLSRSVR